MFLQPRLLTHSASVSQSEPADSAVSGSGHETVQKRVLRPAKIWGQTISVIPREDCSFRRIDLKGRSQSAVQAAYFKARREALEDEDSFKIVLDKSGVRAGLWGFKNPNTSRSRCLPESLARDGFDTGCRLIETLSGFEGQVWQDGDLIGSRWWRSVPSQQKWVGFLRACEGETKFEFDFVTMPISQEVGFRDNLSPIEFDRDYLSTVFSPQNIAVFAGTLLMCGFVFISTQYIQSTVSLNSVQKKISETSDDTNKILSQRRRALGNMVLAKRYFELGHEGEFLLGLTTLSKALSDKDFKILIASYSDKTLKLQLTGNSDVAVSALVEDLEASNILHNVSIAMPSSGRLTVSADIEDLYTLQEDLYTLQKDQPVSTVNTATDTLTQGGETEAGKTEDGVPW